jgi:iron complex outermembrane receptor protein
MKYTKFQAAIIMIAILLIPATDAISNQEPAKNESLLEKTETLAKDTLNLPGKIVKGVLDFTLKPIVVTPWGTGKEAHNVSKNISVISRKEIENSNAKSLPELLSYQTGIAKTQLLGNPKGATIDIRGFGETSATNVLVLIDGRRTNQIDLSGVDWTQLDINAIESVEIVRGASTVLYGDNASGGVINIITRKGQTEKPVVKIGSEIGSYVRHAEYGTFEGYHDIADYFFSYRHESSNGYRENNRLKFNNWFGRVTLHPVDGLEFGTSVGYHKDEYGMPGALYQVDIDSLVGRRGTNSPDDNAKTEDIFVTIEPSFEQNIGGNQLTASLHGTYRHRETDALSFSFAPPWFFLYIARARHDIDSGDIRPKFEVDSVLFDGAVDNTLILGTDHFLAQDNIRSGNMIDDDVDITKRTCALYIHDNIEIADRFLLNAGYRYEWLRYKFSQKGQVTNNDGIKSNEWAYEVGGGYKYNPSSQVYINFSRSYRYPTTEEYYQTVSESFGMIFGGLNTAIRQQTARNLEVGIKDNSLEWLSVNADLFFIYTEDEIFLEPLTYTNRNYDGKTVRKGVDLEAKANLWNRRVVPYVNYTHQKARFHGGMFDNNYIPFVPQNIFGCGVTVRPIENLTCNVNLSHVGSRFFISDQRNLAQQLNSYTTVDTKVSYRWKNVEIFGGINNLFNRKYSDYGVTNARATAVTFYPSPARTFAVGGTIEL